MRAIFHGAYGLSLGGFPCIRGYATLRDIARVSSADPAYQRELTPGHVEEIKRYFAAGDYLFFPEIVLSTTLAVDYDKPGVPADDPLAMVMRGHKFKSNVNDLRIVPRTSRYDISVADGDRPFKRIDGNHRLSALEALDDEKYDRFLAPFCIILFNPTDAPRNEKALFHNINSKARKLTSEESLRGIIDDQGGFPDDVLSEQFGTEYLQCRQLRAKLNFEYLPHLRTVFGKVEGAQECHRSILIQSLQDVRGQFTRLELDELPTTKSVFEAIREVNDIYADERLQRSQAQGLFAAFLFWQLKPGASAGQISQFTNWVLRTHQYELGSINAADLIKIFEKIAESRRRQIFISMAFSEATKSNYDAMKAAVDDLNAKHKLDIKLREIRVDQFDTGYSYEINKEILELIENSGLMIADLSGGNKNVHHEIGYLMGLNRGNGLADENFLLVHNEQMGDPAKDIGFNLAGIKQLRVKDTNGLREDVKKQVELFYGLAGE
ncbi:MAG: DNA sulfur modification protein DndB [Blastomonas sp.]